MAYVDIVTALAILQFMVFAGKVARARGRYGIAAPATTGTEAAPAGPGGIHGHAHGEAMLG